MTQYPSTLRTIHTATVPEEPPVGSVVLDKDGLVWQRLKVNEPYPSWVPAQLSFHGPDMHSNYWPKLLVDNGPLIELYRPEEPKKGASK